VDARRDVDALDWCLETEEYMHVSQLYPNMSNLKADWSDGTITTMYA
jgi:hypothetical protein